MFFEPVTNHLNYGILALIIKMIAMRDDFDMAMLTASRLKLFGWIAVHIL
jgi:hypothetical protein